MDLKSIQTALQQIAEEKGLDAQKVLETVEMAIAAAYKKDFGKKGQLIRASFDLKTGEIMFRQIKIVVDESMLKTEEEIAEEERKKMEEVAIALTEKKRPLRKRDDEDEFEPLGEEKKVRFNPEKHIMLDEAKKIKKDAAVGDEIDFALESHIDYGRIAAQTAKQVIIQRIREAERSSIFTEYKSKEGTIVNGLVQRMEGRIVFVDIGRTIAVLSPEEQVPLERYRLGERIKCYILSVQENPRGPGIFLSRSHPKLLLKLFEVEVPEVAAGTVEIRAIAREAGSRSKVAVVSHEEGVDPVGSLVGQKGVRVMAVINELGGEKIDIIEWSDDSASLISNALSPAKVLGVELNAGTHEARVIVPHDELSLAIGKKGQNVRLAAKLTGWKIDLRSDAKPNVPAETPEAIVPGEAPMVQSASLPTLQSASPDQSVGGDAPVAQSTEGSASKILAPESEAPAATEKPAAQTKVRKKSSKKSKEL